MNGYILESRTILDSEIWNKPPLYFKVWHYLLMKAQHADYRSLKRGQLFTSIDQIREACSYYIGYRKITPSRKEIFGILDWLRKSGEGNNEGNNEGNMIVTTKVTHGMVISIVNYGVYQDPKSYEGNNVKSMKVTTKEQRKESEGNNKNKKIKKNNKNDKREGQAPRSFLPPSRQDIEAYCKDKGYYIDAQLFIDYYDARDWTLGKGQKMSNWKSAVNAWVRRERKNVGEGISDEQAKRMERKTEEILKERKRKEQEAHTYDMEKFKELRRKANV